MTSIEKFQALLKLAVQHKASDLHLKSRKNPVFRIDGHLKDVETSPFSPEDLSTVVASVIPPQFRNNWETQFQSDFSVVVEGAGRFRCNVFYQRGVPGMVLRHVKDKIPTFEEINLIPDGFTSICEMSNGIALLCGATGSGKSTTLAAMIDYINTRQDKHIVTLEDPIEYTYKDKRSLINQREVGIDVPSFQMGMKAAMREDPDVILVGEMRDGDTFETALRASETGHLVFGTLHASSAQQAVQRLFEFFPINARDAMQPQVAASLRATITQKLVPAVDGGRVPVMEFFMIDALGRQIIESGEFDKIPKLVESSESIHTTSFNKDLLRLVHAGTITKTEAMMASPNPKKLEMNLKGIFLSSGGIVD